MAKGNGGPQLGCGAKMIKFCLITFNIIFFVRKKFFISFIQMIKIFLIFKKTKKTTDSWNCNTCNWYLCFG
jgi:hypothetical protein